MMDKFSKKNFYAMMLYDRLPLARVDFPTEQGEGSIELFATPLGTAARASVPVGERLREIKMYDKRRSKFVIQNVFCGDNLVEISSGVFVGVSNKLHLQDAIERDFLIKTDNMTIVARAYVLPRKECVVDKSQRMVYN